MVPEAKESPNINIRGIWIDHKGKLVYCTVTNLISDYNAENN